MGEMQKRHELQRAMLKLYKAQRDLAHLVLGGALDFEQASPGVQAMLMTRILHPELAEVLDRPEEFLGPSLPQESLEEPNPAAHAHFHAVVLENAMKNEEAAGALHNLLSVAGQYHDDLFDALHVAVHVLTMIHLQQIWGASVAAQGETAARRNRGKAALIEANTWFENVSKGRVRKLPGPFRQVLRHAPAHPAW